MASSNTTTTTTTNHHSPPPPPPYGSEPTTPNTTFVQANPSNFREVVQKLTGASEDPSAQKLPITLPSRLAAQQAQQVHRLPTTTTTTTDNTIGPKKPNFKLHERRAKKLELNNNNIGVSETPTIFINNTNNNNNNNNNLMMMMMMSNMNMSSPSLSYIRNSGGIIASPVSPLDHVLARGSPRTPKSPYDEDQEEKRVIAEKGFYLHPSPRASQPPELLPLFPLHSPSSNNSSSPS